MSAAPHTPHDLLAEQRRPAPDRRPPGRAPERAPVIRAAHAETYRVLGALSIVTGALHAKAMADHASHYWLYGVFFGLLTCWQAGWGVRAYRARLRRRALVAGAWINVAVVVVWLVSRTVGMPIGPWAGEPEAIGVIDAMASLDELTIAALVASLASAAPRPAFAWLRGSYAVRLGMMLGSASLFALTIGGHTH
jgi:hypothetical protein